jgi:TolB-like protein
MASCEVYEFGDFRLDAPQRLLSREGHAIALAPKTYDVLLALVRSAGRLTAKRELLDLVWPETFVEEGILAVHISALRKALTDDEGGGRYIETVSARDTASLPLSSVLLKSNHCLHSHPLRCFRRDPFSAKSTGLAIADALIDRLGRCRQIVVRPTRAVRAYLNTPDDPAAIGRSLRVHAVIDTRFLATANSVHVSIHLIRSQDGISLWTGNFDQPPAEVVTIADLVAERVAAQFGSVFQENATPRSTVRPAAHPKVYELVGRGRFHLLSYSMFEVPKAVEAFRAALELDPTYGPAHAGLSLACCAQATMRVAPAAQAYNDARVAALHALAMDDSCVDAQVALGAVLFFSEWNWAGAERSLNRAL